MRNSESKDKRPWDENLPENAKLIKKLYRKSEKEIKKMDDKEETGQS